jgi:DNA-binding NtrC family response regulator
VKLLRALDDGEIDPVGARRPIKVSFRLISATNRDMVRLVREGRFREDLFYRLNAFPIWMPPLRERPEDIPALAHHFLARFANEEGRRMPTIGAEALDLLARYSWPGNVRQLENAMFRGVVLSDGPELTVAELPEIAAHADVRREPAVAVAAAPSRETAGNPAATALPQLAPAARPMHMPIAVAPPPVMLGAERTVPQTIAVGNGGLGILAITAQGELRSLEAMEADMIRLALGRSRGRAEAARWLGIGRSTLYRKMREFGLEARAPGSEGPAAPERNGAAAPHASQAAGSPGIPGTDRPDIAA